MQCLASKIRDKFAPNSIFLQCFVPCNSHVVKGDPKESVMLSLSLEFCQLHYAVLGSCLNRILLFEDIQEYVTNEQLDSKYSIL